MDRRFLESHGRRVAEIGTRLTENFLREHPWVDFLPRVNVRLEERGHSYFTVVEIDSSSFHSAGASRPKDHPRKELRGAPGSGEGNLRRGGVVEVCKSCGNPSSELCWWLVRRFRGGPSALYESLCRGCQEMALAAEAALEAYRRLTTRKDAWFFGEVPRRRAWEVRGGA